MSKIIILDFNCSLNGFSLTKEIVDESIFNVSLICNEAANGAALAALLLLGIAAWRNRKLRFHCSLLPMVVIISEILSQICSTVEMRIFKIHKNCGFLALLSSFGGEFFSCVTVLAVLFFRLNLQKAKLIPFLPDIGRVCALCLIPIVSFLSAFAMVIVQGTTMNIVNRSIMAFILVLSLTLSLLGVKKKEEKNKVQDITLKKIKPDDDEISLGSRLENPVESNARCAIRPATAEPSERKTEEETKETTENKKKEKKSKKKTLEETLSQISGDEKDPKHGGAKKKKEPPQPPNNSLKYVQQNGSSGTSSKETEAAKEIKGIPLEGTQKNGKEQQGGPNRNDENTSEQQKSDEDRERDIQLVENETYRITKKSNAELRVGFAIIMAVMFTCEIIAFCFLSSSGNLIVKMVKTLVPMCSIAYWFYVFKLEEEDIAKVLKDYDILYGKRVSSGDEVVGEDDVAVYGTMEV